MKNKLRLLYNLVLNKILELQGDPPLIVSSQTKVDNLNADLLDGYHASELSYKTYTKQLDSTDIGNKYVILPDTPSAPEKTILLIRNAGIQIYNVDYTVSGNRVSWDGYDTTNSLEVGTWITILYF